MKTIGIIPARYESSRYRGKPLADICGKPMVWWVYQQAAKVSDFADVLVATDDDKIFSVCRSLSMNAIMTDSSHPTGTDRVAEVARKIQADLYVNIQGDEPLLEPEVIKVAIQPFLSRSDLWVTNLMAVIDNGVDTVNYTIPKVLVNRENMGVYLTRSAAPFPKGRCDFEYYKQVCVYGFTPEALQYYAETPRGYLESIEDIEILRFIENQKPVLYIPVKTSSVAVDTPKDLERVKKIMAERESQY